MSVAWFDDVTITVEAALSAATGDYGAWDSGVWDTATWGPDIVWSDITTYVRGFSTGRRFGREVQAWEAGRAAIVLKNDDGRFSPSNLDGPYVTGGITGIRPWRPLRIRATYNSVTYDVYTGYALAWIESFTLGPEGGGDAIVTVPCADELARLAGFDGFAQSAAGGGELSGERIHRVLDNAGHTGVRNIETGVVTLQATTLASNAVTELKLTADSEGGALFIGADGSVVFEGQASLADNARSNTVQATFGDGNPNLLTKNQSDFETDTTGWTGFDNCSIARSTAQARQGLASLAVTTTANGTATPGTPRGTSGLAVTGGQGYTAVVSVLTPAAARTARCYVTWFDSGGSALSDDVGTTVATSTSAWTDLSVTATAPASAAYVSLQVQVFSTLAAEVSYVDQAQIVQGSGTAWVVGTSGVAELSYSDIQVAYDGDLLVNMAAYARVGGTEQSVSDNTSRALYGDRQASRTDLLCQTDAQVEGLAGIAVAVGKHPELRVTSITVKPRAAPASLFPQVLGRRPRDLVRVIRRPPGGHTITRDCFIAGISHSVRDGEWITVFDLWSATAWNTFGRWDTATWDTSTWFI